jgi:hypothetical protein
MDSNNMNIYCNNSLNINTTNFNALTINGLNLTRTVVSVSNSFYISVAGIPNTAPVWPPPNFFINSVILGMTSLPQSLNINSVSINIGFSNPGLYLISFFDSGYTVGASQVCYIGSQAVAPYTYTNPLWNNTGGNPFLVPPNQVYGGANGYNTIRINTTQNIDRLSIVVLNNL